MVVTEHNPEVDQSTAEPQHKSEPFDTESDRGGASVEFSIDDVNHDYAKGVFMRNARSLQADFVGLYKEEPKAKFRLTLERL